MKNINVMWIILIFQREIKEIKEKPLNFRRVRPALCRLDASVGPEGCVQRFKSLGHAYILIRAAGCAILAGLHGEWSWANRLKKPNQFPDMKRCEDTKWTNAVAFLCSLECNVFYLPSPLAIFPQLKRLSVNSTPNGSQDRLDPAGTEGTCQFPVDAHLGNLSGIRNELRPRQPPPPPAQLRSAERELHGLTRRVLQKCSSAAAGGCVWKTGRARRRRSSEGKCPEEGLAVAVLLFAGLGGRELVALRLLAANRQFERRRGGQPVFTLRRARVEREQPPTATSTSASPHCSATLSQHATILRPHPHRDEKSAWEQAPTPPPAPTPSVKLIRPQEASEQGQHFPRPQPAAVLRLQWTLCRLSL